MVLLFISLSGDQGYRKKNDPVQWRKTDLITLDLDMCVLSRVTSCPSLRSEELLGTSNINQESPRQATTLGHPSAALELYLRERAGVGACLDFLA